jgi:hypothetical protein
VDGRDGIEVDLYSEPNEIRTSVITLYDLGAGPHTLTIEVLATRNPKALSNVVTVDAFEVEPQILSRFQETDPDVTLTAGWIQDPSGTWSGGGVASGGHPRYGGMRYTETAGEKATVRFRGTSIAWSGYRGPDGGIAIVRLDEGAPVEVDTYRRNIKNQEVVFTATGLPDTNHTLTIEMTDRRNPQAIAIATGPVRIVVDAFEVTTPGRRYQQRDPAISYSGQWTRDNDNRSWSEGRADTTETAGSRAKFEFTGTSVSWIGCQKESIGSANIYVDGVFIEKVTNFKPVPIEGYQRTIFRKDGLTPGTHTLEIEAASSSGFVVVDAFDVRP